MNRNFWRSWVCSLKRCFSYAYLRVVLHILFLGGA